MNPLKLATLLAMLAVTVICAPLEGTISLFHQKLAPNLDIDSNLVVEPPTGVGAGVYGRFSCDLWPTFFLRSWASSSYLP
jgi:hypothetical protein